jgi:hypothetical protein
MEDLGHRVLTAQNGPEALSIESAVSRSTDLVIRTVSAGAKLGSGYSAKISPAAAAGLPNVPQSCARFSRESTKLSEADAFRKSSPARPAVALSGVCHLCQR